MNPSSDSVRAFIAVEVPADVQDEVLRLIGRFRTQGFPVRWVGRDHLHLTLVFLGYSPSEFISGVKLRLAEVAGRSRRFDLSLQNLGVFPNERSPRVIWLGVDQGRAELCDLATRVQAELAMLGFVPERRPFSPHLTLGRVKERLPDAQPILERKYASRAFPITRLVLFQSHLKPTGPVYEHLGEYPLAGNSGPAA